MIRVAAFATTLAVLGSGLAAIDASAFSQRSPATPIGHEWLVVEAAKGFPELNAKNNEVNWKNAGCVECNVTDYARYGTKSHKVWSAVMGQRWVDIMGFLAVDKCFDAVAQSNEEVQYDHFLRGRKDDGLAGRTKAIAASLSRLRAYFKAAVAADESPMLFTDGGAMQNTKFKGVKAYFYFGRAVHLFQDAFSPEHADRVEGIVYDIKSYLCTSGAPQHTHKYGGLLPSTVQGLDSYDNHGDVIWKNPVGGNSVSNLKPHGLVALTAMIDFWQGFLDARKNKLSADAAMDAIIAKWFKIADQPRFTVTGAPPNCTPPSEAEINQTRSLCLAKTGWGAFGDKLKPKFALPSEITLNPTEDEGVKADPTSYTLDFETTQSATPSISDGATQLQRSPVKSHKTCLKESTGLSQKEVERIVKECNEKYLQQAPVNCLAVTLKSPDPKKIWDMCWNACKSQKNCTKPRDKGEPCRGKRWEGPCKTGLCQGAVTSGTCP